MPSSSSRTPRRTLRLLAIPVLAVGAALLVSAILAPTAGVAAWAAKVVDATWMDVPPLPDDLRELAVRSTITDRDGERIATIRDENRVLVDGDRIPEHVREAVIATEDQSFYDHEGVDWQAVARAGLGNVLALEVTSGGSTITQQLVKNVVIAGPGELVEQSIERKIREAIYAIELEQRLGKDDILNQYLNTAYFGGGVYGVGTAAEHYWGKAVEELAVQEAALLAGMLRAPERHDPVDRPEAAESRRNVVLRQMAEVGFLSEPEAESLADRPLGVEARDEPEGRNRDPITDFVIRTIEGVSDGHPLAERLPGITALGTTPEERFNSLATGGYEIRTSLDRELQQLANGAVREHLAPDQSAHAAVTAVHPQTGELLAMGFGPNTYGGENTDFHPGVPGLGSPGRQTGSAFKAFGVVTALDGGVPPTYTADPPHPYQPAEDGHCPSDYTPTNYAGLPSGQMDLYEATAKSSNVFFVHLVDQVISPLELQEVAQRMGVPGTGANCSSVLGTDTVYGIDMAGAFATLANEGERCEPHAIVEIVDRHGEVVYQHDGSCEQVLDAETAVRATEVLRGPIQNGTASSSARIGRPAAGKTGTTSEYGNAWFVGYVPQLAASVWAGNEEPADRFEHPACGGGVTGGCLPARMWATFMQEAVATLELPPEPFPSPPPLPTAEVPDVLGLDEEEAVADVEDAGLTPFAEQIEHHAEAGTVVEQEPEGGARKPEGSAVELAVSDGTGEPPVMPYLIGMSRDEALEILEQTGIEAEVEEVPVDDPDELDQVVGQSPTHGTELEGDDEDVTLEVGRPRRDDDPPPTPTPDPDDDDSGVELPTPAPPSDNEDEGHDSGDGDGGGDGIDLGDGHDDGGDSGDSGSDPGDDGTDGDAGSGDGDTGDGTDSGSDSGDGAGDGSGDSSGNGSGNGSGDSSGEDGGEDGS